MGRRTVEAAPTPGISAAYALAVLDAALDAVITIDHAGTVLEFNPAAERIFGYTRAEVLGRELAGLIVPPEARDAHRRALARWTEDGPAPGAGRVLGQRIEVDAMRSDGTRFPVELAISRVEGADSPLFTACLRDITERRRSEDARREAEARYRTLVEQLPLAVYIDRIDDVSSNIYTSPQIERMLGYPVEDWISTPTMMVDILHPDDRERVVAAHQRTHLSGDPLLIEYRYLARDGRVVWVRDEARIIEDPQTGMRILQGYLLDITARKEAEEQLRHQAFHDALTGLANRALFTDRVEHALVRKADGEEVAVLFLDIDDFKAVNDALGHLAGDQLLRAVGARLRASLSPSLTVARMGGDEFAILVEDDGAVAAGLRAAEDIAAAMDEPFDLAGRSISVTTSIGIAVGRDAEELLRRSDVALYGAKANGKARHVVYAPKMDERLRLRNDLRRARIDEELVLHYQPVVEIVTGDLLGVEALVRWQHPVRGLLPPADFIDLAEETGRMGELGCWVLNEACRQTAHWHRTLRRRLGVSVNISTSHVRSPDLLDAVNRALDESGLAPGDLMLEITETVLAGRRDELATVLEDVTSRGVLIALDDFGTGYSSLSLLQDLPVHVLKIDRAFVQSIGADGSREAFVRAIVELAKALGVTVVAEGIANLGQLVTLRKLGCRVGQGFHFARPMTAADFEAFVAARHGRFAA